MNQEKIGKFIAQRREHKKLKQKDLADKLGVTNKAISKWENGRGMPDYSLFKDLCKELDISVSELLNGELDNEDKANNKDAITEYLSYKETKHKKKNIVLIAVLVLTILISTLLIYFINSYKKITIYELSGESENFKYENGLLVTSNIKTILELGTLSSNTINEDQIIGETLTVKIDNEYYFISNIADGEVISENYGYGEYLSDTKLKYIPANLYILIWYRVDDEIKSEILKVTNERLLINDKIIYPKKDSIDEIELNNPIDLNKYDNVNTCETHFTNLGFKKQGNGFRKQPKNTEYIDFNCYSNPTYYSYMYDTKELRVKSYNYSYKEDSEYSTIRFHIYDKKNNINCSLVYDFYRKKITGTEEAMKYKKYVERAIKLFEENMYHKNSN